MGKHDRRGLDVCFTAGLHAAPVSIPEDLSDALLSYVTLILPLRQLLPNSAEPAIHRLHGLETPALRSSSATRASMSSISIALAEWLRSASAARRRTDAGVF